MKHIPWMRSSDCTASTSLRTNTLPVVLGCPFWLFRLPLLFCLLGCGQQVLMWLLSRQLKQVTSLSRHSVSWLRTSNNMLKSLTGRLGSTGPLSPTLVVILPRRGRIQFSTNESHRLLLLPMTSIGIPVEYYFLPLILIKDSAHVGQLCKVGKSMIVYHHLYFWSKAIDELDTLGPLSSFPLIMRKVLD